MFEDRRRVAIIAVLGILFVCLVGVIIGTFLPPGEEGSAPAEGATQVQLPEETPIPTNTLEPTSTPRPTATPTAVPTETPVINEDVLAAEYFIELGPGIKALTNTFEDLSELFLNLNPQLLDLDWYKDVTEVMLTLSETALYLAEIPVPDNCDVCLKMQYELLSISISTYDLNLDWLDFLLDPYETSYFEDMDMHLTEIWVALNYAQKIIEDFIEDY